MTSLALHPGRVARSRPEARAAAGAVAIIVLRVTGPSLDAAERRHRRSVPPPSIAGWIGTDLLGALGLGCILLGLAVLLAFLVNDAVHARPRLAQLEARVEALEGNPNGAEGR